jgi:DNA mismatch endonuclease (patch repair protein)
VKVAVYIDGCFWHSCPKHSTIPKANRDWWVRKLDRNKERDQQTDRALSRHGWKVIRIWEHEDPIAAANRIEKVVKERRAHAQ